MYCSGCGSENSVKASFCTSCGASLRQNQAARVTFVRVEGMACPKCGTIMKLRQERQDVGKFLAALGCLSCLLAPAGCVLAPFAFMLPKKNYNVCPKCGTEVQVS